MEVTRTKLAEGMYLTCLPAQKFKTSLLSAQFVTPLRRETVSSCALLPALLSCFLHQVVFVDFGHAFLIE